MGFNLIGKVTTDLPQVVNMKYSRKGLVPPKYCSAWRLNTEHCYIMSKNLRTHVIQFTKYVFYVSITGNNYAVTASF